MKNTRYMSNIIFISDNANPDKSHGDYQKWQRFRSMKGQSGSR